MPTGAQEGEPAASERHENAGASAALVVADRRPTFARPLVLRGILIALFALAALLSAYLGVIAWKIWLTARSDQAQPADAIVVFGAAEYRGRPSPVLRARIEHALALYRRGLARKVITTGGPGGDPNFTEAGVERNYLVAHGVSSEDVMMEDESSSTSETVLNVIEIMKRSDLRSCVVVSDGYHLFRIVHLFKQKGIAAYGSPRTGRVYASFWTRLRITVKEVFGYVFSEIGIRV